jgi:hypothetical protein
MRNRQEASWVESAWKAVESELEQEKDRICDAIRGYPPPITACDEQFDQLLEKRDRISRELRRMREVSRASLTHQDAARLIDEFIRSTSFIGEEAEQRIRTSLRRVPPRCP